MSTCLFIIDPQRDFMDDETSPVSIPGAAIDMMNVSDMLYQYGDQVDHIVVSLDSHPYNHIAHAEMWVDSHDRNPRHFDEIAYSDILSGRWRAINQEDQELQADYVRTAELASHPLMIWPRHCIMGSQGAAIYRRLANDIDAWANPRRQAHMYNKSGNWSTEHLSSFRAIVYRLDDMSTLWNDQLYKDIQADTILLAGETLSHELRETIQDAMRVDPEIIKRMIILEDATSPRVGYRVQAQEFLHEFCTNGGRIDRSDHIFRYTLCDEY